MPFKVFVFVALQTE